MIEDNEDDLIITSMLYYNSPEEKTIALNTLDEWKKESLQQSECILIKEELTDDYSEYNRTRFIRMKLTLSYLECKENDEEASFWEDFQGYCRSKVKSVHP